MKIFSIGPTEKIDRDGVYDLSMMRYHGQPCVGPSISGSGLKKLDGPGKGKSPAHYWVSSSLNPDRIEEEETEALTIGRAAHHVLLGESEFAKQFRRKPEELHGLPWHGNRKDCKAWLSEQALAGITVLTELQIEMIRGMGRSLSQHALVRNGILNGLIEKSIVWKDLETGVWLKIRPDAIPTSSADFADLKTTVSVDVYELARTIYDYGYHISAALIGMGCRAVLGVQMTSFTLVFVEKKPPYCVRIVQLPDADILRGEALVRRAINRFAECLDTGIWPGPGDMNDAEFVSLPQFAQNRIDAILKENP